MERQDLRSVLRLFAEIASSMQQDQASGAPDEVEAGEDLGEDLLPGTGEDSWAPSIAR